jgi:hypothetical protein
MQHLAFRDFMREQANWIERFSALKWSLCEECGDESGAHIEQKSAMYEEFRALALNASDQVFD